MSASDELETGAISGAAGEVVVHHHHHYQFPHLRIPIGPFTVTPWTILLWNVVHTALWILMLPIALLTGLRVSVPFLVGISVWALVMSGISATVAAYGVWRVWKDQG